MDVAGAHRKVAGSVGHWLVGRPAPRVTIFDVQLLQTSNSSQSKTPKGAAAPSPTPEHRPTQDRDQFVTYARLKGERGRKLTYTAWPQDEPAAWPRPWQRSSCRRPRFALPTRHHWASIRWANGVL